MLYGPHYKVWRHFSYSVAEDKLVETLQSQGFAGFQRQVINLEISRLKKQPFASVIKLTSPCLEEYLGWIYNITGFCSWTLQTLFLFHSPWVIVVPVIPIRLLVSYTLQWMGVFLMQEDFAQQRKILPQPSSHLRAQPAKQTEF